MPKSRLDRVWKKILVTCFLAATLTARGADAFLDSSATGRFLLDPSLARDLLRQCSRATPASVSGVWQPSLQDIDELELALPKYLEARTKAGQETPPKGHTYHRQYVGFTRKFERFIYGNFYPAREARGYWKGKESKQALVICDGGPAFWGIVYRVSTKTFEELQFNGLG